MARSSGYYFYPDKDVNIRDEKGNSPLYYATVNKDWPFI